MLAASRAPSPPRRTAGRAARCAGPLLLALLAPAASAQQFARGAEGEDGSHFGWTLCNVGDVNGDGCDDLAVGAPFWNNGAVVDAGQMTLLDGASGTTLRTVDGTRSLAHLGKAIAAVGDWSGDGVPDYVVGTPDATVGLAEVGLMTLYDGASGKALRTEFGVVAYEELGGALAAVGDLDGDGVRELLAGVPTLGEARLYDSAFHLLATFTGSVSDDYGAQVARLDDLDGDGVEEFAVSEPGYDSLIPAKSNRGRVLIYSGATHAQLASLQGLEAGDYFGQHIERLDDLDGDGVDEFAIATHLANLGGLDHGQVRIFSGATRATLHTLDGVATGDSFGFSLTRVPDLDHDGIDDFAVGIFNGGADDVGSVEVRAGADARVLWTVEGSDGSLFWKDDSVGYAVAGGDWNGDGIGDLALGDPSHRTYDFLTATWTDPGRVEFWLGAPAFTESYGAGWPGKLGVPGLDALTTPEFGTTLLVSVDNSAGLPTTALLLVGTSTAAIPWKDGTLLVNADVASLLFPLATFGALLDADIPDDPALAFVDLYVQVVEADPAASKKLSFTPGLRLRLGYDLP